MTKPEKRMIPKNYTGNEKTIVGKSDMRKINAILDNLRWMNYQIKAIKEEIKYIKKYKK